jgi:hypothetical protein
MEDERIKTARPFISSLTILALDLYDICKYLHTSSLDQSLEDYASGTVMISTQR